MSNLKYVVNARGTTVTDALREYIEKRFSKFEKYLLANQAHDIIVYTKIEVKDNGNRYKVEVTIPVGKKIFRAEQNNLHDMYAAIDNVEKIMVNRLKKNKEKFLDNKHRGAREPISEMIENEMLEDEKTSVVRTKHHLIENMTEEDALFAMEMIGHSFYNYYDVDAKTFCTLYQRRDGGIGKIEYER